MTTLRISADLARICTLPGGRNCHNFELILGHRSARWSCRNRSDGGKHGGLSDQRDHRAGYLAAGYLDDDLSSGGG